MKIVRKINLNENEKQKIFELWNNEYPEKLAYNFVADFENYLKQLTQQIHYLLLDEHDEINGWATTFTRDNENWFAIIVSEKIHSKGFGTKLLNELKNNEHTLNGWVIDHNTDKKLNGKLYNSPLNFYLKNGFIRLPLIRLELEFISAVKISWSK